MFITWPACSIYDLHVCILMNKNQNLKNMLNLFKMDFLTHEYDFFLFIVFKC